MTARAFDSATISFGLVAVPVKIFPTADSESSISFHLLHRDCGERLRRQYVCPTHGPVDDDAIVKGYALDEGQYVEFSPDELKALEEPTTGRIDVTDFVPVQAIDRVWVRQSYYLGPDKGADRAYHLLGETLHRSGRAGLGQHAARRKRRLVLVRPMDDVLVLEDLFYAHELRSPADIPVGPADIRLPELQLALQIVGRAAADEFRPERFVDPGRERVVAEIARKAGAPVPAAEAPEEDERVLDLMEALRRSLAALEREPGRTHDEGTSGARERMRRASGQRRNAKG